MKESQVLMCCCFLSCADKYDDVKMPCHLILAKLAQKNGPRSAGRCVIAHCLPVHRLCPLPARNLCVRSVEAIRIRLPGC